MIEVPDTSPAAAVLPYARAHAMLQSFGIAMAPAWVIPARGAAELPADLPYPVVVKIDEPSLPHRSDVGGVRLDRRDLSEVLDAREAILLDVARSAPGHQVERMIVQEQIAGGIELHVGMHIDPQFGPVVSVGLGGAWVEILGGHAFRVPPLPRELARSMIAESVPARLLAGARGAEPPHVESLVDLLVSLGDFAARPGLDIVELDLNPVIVTGAGTSVVDCLMIQAVRESVVPEP